MQLIFIEFMFVRWNILVLKTLYRVQKSVENKQEQIYRQ